MSRLLLLRHAKSSWAVEGQRDRERPLSERGEAAAALMAAAIAERGLLPDRVLCSPALRTRQTLAAIAPSLGKGSSILFLEELYAGQDTYTRAIRRSGINAARLLVVGHNPRIHATALELIGAGKKSERARLEEKYPTGALAVIGFDIADWALAGANEGRLEAFLRPRDLSASAEDD
jgi:phosphohistidine phosphatase